VRVSEAVSYTAGQCTAFVESLAPWIDQYGNLGDARSWLGNAKAHGARVSSVPVPGAVAVWGPNMGGAFGDGHVALVTDVKQGLPVVSEMNWTNGPFRSDTRAVPASSASGIIGYILPPTSALADTSVQNAQSSTAGQTASTSATAGSQGGDWSIGPFTILSHHALVRIGYTLAGLGMIGVGVWILFRKEVDSMISAVPKVVPV
jgi:CHAP domain